VVRKVGQGKAGAGLVGSGAALGESGVAGLRGKGVADGVAGAAAAPEGTAVVV